MQYKMTVHSEFHDTPSKNLNNINFNQVNSTLLEDDEVPLPISLASKIKSSEFHFKNITFWSGNGELPPNGCVEKTNKRQNPIPLKPINILTPQFCLRVTYKGAARLRFLNPLTSLELIKHATYFYNAALKIGIEFDSAIEEIKRYKEQYADRIKYKLDPDIDIGRFERGKHIDFNPREYSSGSSTTRKTGEHKITEDSYSSQSTRKIISDRVTQYNEMLAKMENDIAYKMTAFSEKDINNNVNVWLLSQISNTPYRSYDRNSSLIVVDLIKSIFLYHINEAKELGYKLAEINQIK